MSRAVADQSLVVCLRVKHFSRVAERPRALTAVIRALTDSAAEALAAQPPHISPEHPSVIVFTSPGRHAQQSFGIGTAGPSQLPTQH